jgi:two-component system, cell cycle sensor histidine kinase and response regulator CckA
VGEEVTQSVSSAATLRAKFLKAALKSGTPPTLSYAPSSQPAISTHTSLQHSSEPQSGYLQQLFENAPEAITVLDRDFRVVRVNAEFTRTFGYSVEAAVGKPIQSLILPGSLCSEAERNGEALRRGEKVSEETKRRRKDGSLIDVSILATPIDPGTGPIAFYAIYRDISEQKRTQALNSALYRIAEITNSAQDLQQFYQSIHQIVGELMYARNFYIALHDPLTQYLSFPYFVDEEDAPPEPRTLGRGLTEYVLRSGEPLLAVPQIFDQLVDRGEVSPIGAPSVDWLGVPLKLGNTCIGVVVVQSYTDNVRFGEKDKEILTFVSQQLASAIEHKRSEDALRRSEGRYRSLVQSAAYGIYRSNLDGKFVDVNPSLVALLGYNSADEVLGLDPRHDVFLSPEEQSRLIRECSEERRIGNVELKWKRRDQTVITVRLSGRVVAGESGSEQFLEVIAEDITDKRALEDQFRQSQKMEAVGRLAGGVAHDFNNLLMVISGYTEVLLENLELGGNLRAKAEAIQQATDRATTLTRQLLAFSRKQLLELKIVDLNTIVSDMERLLRPLIGENIELVTRLQPELGRTRADAGQLEQVIMNLVVNAKDAMPDGGRIAIQTSNADLDESYRREHSYITPGAYVMLSVSDNGCGMDKETQSRIFEPFFTTKEKGKGTGLGLSTVYGIVKQSGGYIFANSEVGGGSTFRIYLPKVEGEEPAISTKLPPSADLRGWETVLLVEDEESVRQLVRETLELRGYKVIEAENGEEALRAIHDLVNPIHMLITDVVMPGMSGKDLATELLAGRPGMRVLFLSGYTEDALVPEGTLDSGKAFLQKPFTLQHLARKVRELLRSGN